MNQVEPRAGPGSAAPERRRRVLHVINNLPVGGAERFLVLLVAAQRRMGLEVGVCALSQPNPLAGELQSSGIPFTTLGRARLNDPRLALDLWRKLRATRPDVVHTHLFYADTFGRLAARAAGVPAIVSTEHSTEGAPLSRRRLAAMRWTARLAHRLVAVSEAVRRATAARLGLSPDAIEVVPNGIDLEPWVRAEPLPPAALGVEPGAILIGSVGRLDDSKGHEVLIEAVARLADPRLRLLFLGDGPRREALEARAVERGISGSVRWLGWRTDVPRVLASLHVFVQPSRYEGHSMALLEAMAAGRAIVVSAIPELVGTLGEAGLEAAPGDPDALAAALRRLVGDPELRRQFGARARIAAGRFSIATSAARYAALYDALLQRTRGGSKIR